MKTRLLSGLLSLLGFSGIAASCNNEEYQSAGEYGTPYARFTFKGTVRKCVLSAAVESKNRPVATNFQFLKMLCSTGTSHLQLLRVLM